MIIAEVLQDKHELISTIVHMKETKSTIVKPGKYLTGVRHRSVNYYSKGTFISHDCDRRSLTVSCSSSLKTMN